jgi:predicted SAM-dependent methyltransferase
MSPHTLLRNLFVRLILFRRFKQNIKNRPLKLIIGASGTHQSGWAASEIDFLDITKKSDWQKYFQENSIETILAEHVWEHLDETEALTAAKNCLTYLKKNGYARIAVPDGYFPSKKYLNYVKKGNADGHKILHTYQSLKKLFELAGFTVTLLEYYDKKGHFHQSNWDPKTGFISRSARFDERNQSGKLNYTSIILDAKK